MQNVYLGSYVRVAFDNEHKEDPRIFLLGQVTSVNEVKGTVVVTFHDPFGYMNYFTDIPGRYEYYVNNCTRCTASPGSRAVFNGQACHVLSFKREGPKKSVSYYLKRDIDNKVMQAPEQFLKLPFIKPEVSPLYQMLRGEWQNPKWYFNRMAASRAIHLLTGSLSGFNRLAGCKIDILPHQLMTIRRCQMAKPCRMMLADEVGMGKTIEALGVLRLYIDNHPHADVLILVPEHLIAQWRLEMLFKFDLSEHSRSYHITLAASSGAKSQIGKRWDFLIADEVHHALYDEKAYGFLKKLSLSAENVLLLSATPLLARSREYLSLLRLLNPRQYDDVPESEFNKLVENQSIIEKAAFNVYRSLSELKKDAEESDDPYHNEDVEDDIDELESRLTRLKKSLPDDLHIDKYISIWQEKYSASKSSQEDEKSSKDPLYIGKLLTMLGYVSDRYQLDANIIRNRRVKSEEGSKRKLMALPYNCDSENPYERAAFSAVINWATELNNSSAPSNASKLVKGMLGACFSSAFALDAWLKRNASFCPPDDLVGRVRQWVKYEKQIVDDIVLSLDDDGGFKSKICVVISQMNDVVGLHDKAVLFTNYDATWDIYRKCLEDYFFEENVAVYRASDSEEERERNVYRFQSDEKCQFLLVDASGGEGHNFQMADYAVHLDLPWDVVTMEQRIGRIDRLGRHSKKDILSIVPYAEQTTEEDLFNILNEGMNVFEEPLSGLEIIMGSLGEAMDAALKSDLMYGLREMLPKVKEEAGKMRKALINERIYDLNKYIFNDLDRRIKRIVTEYRRRGAKLLAEAMGAWASIAGFNADCIENELWRYSPRKFSYGSAWQTLLIPPRWDEYYRDERSKALMKIQSAVMDDQSFDRRSSKTAENVIIGTFDRDKALELDSVHFFAPGDPVFDCIIGNALSSYRGRCTALRFICDVDWKGFVFSYFLRPNYEVLYENGLLDELCYPFFSYLASEIYNVFVPLDAGQTVGDDVRAAYEKCIQRGVEEDDVPEIAHMGQRNKLKAIREAKLHQMTNAQWLRQSMPSAEWIQQAAAKARRDARKQLMHSSKINDAIERVEEDYRRNKPLDKTEDANVADAIKQALNESDVCLDAVAYIWLEAGK